MGWWRGMEGRETRECRGMLKQGDSKGEEDGEGGEKGEARVGET